MPQTVRKVGAIKPARGASLSEQVFESLHSRVLTLDLPPNTKISEAEIAKVYGVSRQSVRDAFYRLSILGFLIVQPQRATVVSRISSRDIYEARFLRTAIECEVVRQATTHLDDGHLEQLSAQIEDQRDAIANGEYERFHNLDNLFHQSICEMSGFGFTWPAIQEKKAHTDRVRFLSLSFAAETNFKGHVHILDALKARDFAAAAHEMEDHLSHIQEAVETLRADNADWFEGV